jgi:hypothetical protein
MLKRQKNISDGPVFGSILEWNWHVKASLIVVSICFVIQVITADPQTPRNMTLGVLNIVYIAIFPILMIWFAEFLEDVGDFPFEVVVRYCGWILLLAILFLTFTQLGT